MTSLHRDDAAPTAIRGACPSVHDPFAELDGGLARVRLPGGVLSPRAARALAAAVDAVGGAGIELTNRANLQVRGVPPESTTTLRDLLVDADLVDPDPDVDERRNVLASPTAGIDPGELVDVRPHLAAVLRCLATPAATALSPKFGVLIDGGGAVHVRDRAQDLALGAIRDTAGRVGFELRLAGALDDPWTRSARASCWVVEPEQLPALLDAVVAVTAAYGRVGSLLDHVDAGAVCEELAHRVDGMSPRATHDLVRAARASESPVGARPQRQSGRMSVGAIVPLGRIDAVTLHAVADVADAAGADELRISPWRQLLVVGVSVTEARAVAQRLEALGLPVDPAHPAGVVVACVGTRGCASAHTDTLADAVAIIDGLAGLPADARPGSVHVSGCEKGCACPAPAEVSLVGSAGGTYAVHRHDPAPATADPVEQRFGRRVHRALLPEPARNVVVAAGAGAGE